MIEILAHQVLSIQTHADLDKAITTFEQAINLAEPRGYICINVDEGPLMAQFSLKPRYGPDLSLIHI